MAEDPTVIEERERDRQDPVQSQAEKLAAISAERQSRIGATTPNKGETFFDAQSRGRQAGIGATTPNENETFFDAQSRGRQAAIGATTPNEGESFFDAQSRGREQRIANRADFNAPFRTDQRGNRTAIPQATGAQGQTFTARPQKDIRDMLEGGGPRTKREEKRFDQWRKTSSGQNFDFGGFQSSLAKFRRNTLGQSEWDRQMSVAFRDSPSAVFTPPSTGIDSETTEETDEENDVDTSTEVAMNDSLDTIQTSVFDTPTYA